MRRSRVAEEDRLPSNQASSANDRYELTDESSGMTSYFAEAALTAISPGMLPRSSGQPTTKRNAADASAPKRSLLNMPELYKGTAQDGYRGAFSLLPKEVDPMKQTLIYKNRETVRDKSVCLTWIRHCVFIDCCGLKFWDRAGRRWRRGVVQVHLCGDPPTPYQPANPDKHTARISPKH
eukprot:326703_1